MSALLLNYSPPATTPVSDMHHDTDDMEVLIADDRRSRSYHIWSSLSSLRDVPAISTGEHIEEEGFTLARLLKDSPFDELASHVAERDRRIVAMLLEGAHPDAIARPRAHASPLDRADTLPAAVRPAIFG